AIDVQRTFIPRIDDFLQLVLVGIGIKGEEENSDPDERHQERYDKTDQYPLQPDFHSRLKNWGKPQCVYTPRIQNTNLGAWSATGRRNILRPVCNGHLQFLLLLLLWEISKAIKRRRWVRQNAFQRVP